MNFKQLFICLFIPILAFTSCKERNDAYPPAPWTNYFFEKDNIAPRAISAILVLNDHDEWFGSRGAEGLIHNDGYTWTVFDQTNTGIQFDSITSILMDGNGLLWVSWKSGAATYDGTSWKNIPELSGRKVTSLALQGIGILWAGIDGDSQTGGLACFSNGSWTIYNPAGSGIPSSHITSVVIDHNQDIWAGSTDKGVIHRIGDVWLSFYDGTLNIRSSDFSSLALDPEGNVWAGNAASQLVKFGGEAPVVLDTGTGKEITSVVAGNDGKIWAGTMGAGLVSFDGSNWISYTVQNMRLPGDTIIALAVHPDGHTLASFRDGHIIYFK